MAQCRCRSRGRLTGAVSRRQRRYGRRDLRHRALPPPRMRRRGPEAEAARSEIGLRELVEPRDVTSRRRESSQQSTGFKVGDTSGSYCVQQQDCFVELCYRAETENCLYASSRD